MTLDFSRPGKPTDNPYIESFNGSFRDECLNLHWCLSVDDAREKIEQWRLEYNCDRQHLRGVALIFGSCCFGFLAPCLDPVSVTSNPDIVCTDGIKHPVNLGRSVQSLVIIRKLIIRI